MKRTLLFIACLLAALTMSAQEGLAVENKQNSGCLSQTRGEDAEPVPTIVLTKEESVLSVQLLNYTENCGTTDFNVTSSLSGGSNSGSCSLTVNVEPVIPQGYWCECPFNVSFTVRDLEPNRFYLDCWWFKGLVELTEGEPMVLEYKVENVTIDGIYYNLDNEAKTAEVTKSPSQYQGDVAIPESVNYNDVVYSVISIGELAFAGCDGLTSITIGSGIKAIYYQAFAACPKLTNVYCYAEKVPNVQGNNIFTNTNIANATLHVPAASVGAYQAVEPWKNFKEIVALPAQAGKTEINKQNFPDDNFRNYVLSTAVDRNQNGILDDDEILHVTDIDVHQKKIVNLKGIEYFKELHKLTCYQNDLTELDLSACAKLDTLNCAGNKLTVLNLSNCSKLKWIRCDQNQLSELDASACTELKLLVCSSNKITTLDVSACRKLADFQCHINNLTKLDVSNNMELVKLYCDYNQLTELDLSNNTKLENCNCSVNKITKLKLSKDNVLTQLPCFQNQLHGGAMDHIIENLNENHAGYICVYDADNEDLEKNICTTTQVATIRSKGWNVYQWLYDEYHVYDGSVLTDDYRPFVEEGKVWKVGSTLIRDNIVKMVEYYYFDGDTIIDGKTCKQMMCQRYVNPEYPDYAIVMQYPLLRYVGAWYEEDKKVYFYNADGNKMVMYDFSLDTDDTFMINGYGPYGIGPKQTGGLEGFKGVYRDLLWSVDGSRCTTWLEGVGGIDGPTTTVYYGAENHTKFLMSCTVGDEVIYLNDEYEDGATPEAARKRFDFTHTIKTKPKAPINSEEARMRNGEEQSMYGEYNDQQLCINLDPLDDTYLVSITSESGKVVYERNVNTCNIIALNIDISAYAEGCYTVTVENNNESFVGEFETHTTGIEEVRSKRSEVGDHIYNLQGQRLSSLRRGLNIVNGQKVYVK